MTTYTVASGETSSGIILNGGDAEIVLSGGTAVDTTVSSGGSQLVDAGGTEVQASVGSGGAETVSSGGVASGTVVSGGVDTILVGGVLNDAIVDGGILNVYGLEIGTTLSGGTEIVYADAVIPVIGSGAELILSSGALSLSATVLNSGLLVVSDGGRAIGTFVSSGGSQSVVSGGVEVRASIGAGGLEVVSSGGVASATVVSGGVETILVGAVLSKAVVRAGLLNVYGSETSTTVSGGTEVLYSGASMSGVTVVGGAEFVSSGGIASAVVVSASGLQEVFSGGTATSTTIGSGGTLELFRGATTISATFLAGGALAIAGGFVQVGSGVASGLTLYALAGGTASDTVVSSGGTEIVSSGGSASGVTVFGVLEVFGGASVSGITLEPGGTLEIASGLVESGFAVSGTSLVVLPGGTAIADTVSSDGGVVLTSGGTASGTILGNGGSETVSAGGAEIGGIVRMGGTQTIAAGAIVSATMVSSGGTELVASGGTALVPDVLRGGTVLVASGGVVIAASVASGGTVVFASGGTNVISGSTLIVSFGDTVIDTDAESGGVITILSGGSAVGGVVSGGGTQIVSSGGAGSGTTVSGGTEIVSSGGTEIGAYLLGGGNQVVAGIVVGTVLDDNSVQTVAAGEASSTTISAGGSQVVLSGGTSVDTTVSSGGSEIVSSGGSSIDTTVSSGGSEIVSSGGSSVDTTISSGGFEVVSSGGSSIDTTISGGGAEIVSSGGTSVDATVSSGGSEIVFSGGSSVDTAISSGGFEIVSSGGASVDATVSSGGSEIVSSGGSSVDTAISSGGFEDVSSGGTSVDATVSSGGSEIVSSGGSSIDATISSGGFEVVSSGGNVIDAIVSGGGTMEVVSGGIVEGAVTFIDTGGLLQIDGANLPVDPDYLIGGATVSGFAAGDTIDLTGVAYDASGAVNLLVGDELQVTENGETYDLQLDGDLDGDYFHLGPDGGTGIKITEDQTACYCQGTLIRTDRGEVAVEELSVGDRVMTLSGEAKPIRWIGRRSYAGRFLAHNRDVLPIVIKARALDDATPARDLWVSPEHALFIDNALVPARLLVNGETIVQVAGVGSVEYFHIELASHDVIFAEGAAAESFVDDDSRLMFHNAAEFYALYPEAGARVPAIYCAPRVEDGFVLEALRRGLAGRARRLGADGRAAPASLRGHVDAASHARIEGWAFDPASPGEPVTIVVTDNGAVIGRVVADRFRPDLKRAGFGDGCHGFAYAVPGGLAAGVQHRLALFSEADWAPLLSVPIVLKPEGAAQSAPLGVLRGKLDKAGHLRISGWAQDSADGERPVGLEIRANGAVIGRLLANRYRADLVVAGVGGGRHAFELVMPQGLSALEPQVISVVREADGAELPGSPMILPAAGGFDAGLEASLGGLFARIGADDEEERALEFLARETDRLLARRAEREGGRAQREAHQLHRRRWGWSAPEGMAAPAAPGLRALVIDDRVPCATRDAGSVAILSHARALRALGYGVSFVAADEIGSTLALQALAGEGITGCGAPHYSCVEDLLCRQAGTFDLVYLHRLGNAERYLPLTRRYNPKARIVYSVADLHHLRTARQAQIEARPELLALSRRMAAGEVMAARRADLVLTHSPVEAEWLRREVGAHKVHVVPFAVSQEAVRRPFAERQGIAILGSFAHVANPDAVHHLLRDILPLVWQRDPSLTCKVAGHGWSADRLPNLDKRVEVLGPVEDLAALFDTVRLTVAPLRFGAGIKGKVLDSFAACVPCVMTPVAAEGLPLTPALQALVAGNPAAFAERILHHHADETANTTAGSEAAALVNHHFTNTQVTQALHSVLTGENRTARALVAT